MRDEFYVILPSSSSKYLFPENSPTHFTTQLPQDFCLHGDWCVGLTEIQIPLTFQHISMEKGEGSICVKTTQRVKVAPNDLRFKKETQTFSQLKPGIYNDIPSLLSEINNLNNVKSHLVFEEQCGGFVQIKCTSQKECADFEHSFTFSEKLCRILGIENNKVLSCDGKGVIYITGNRPANLINGLPNVMMVYSSICQPYVTGDGHTRLLRVVPLHLHDYTYGGTEIKNFSPPMYLPLLSSTFQSIEIDIKDQHGRALSFDYGTLTVTLHFKRTN